MKKIFFCLMIMQILLFNVIIGWNGETHRYINKNGFEMFYIDSKYLFSAEATNVIKIVDDLKKYEDLFVEYSTYPDKDQRENSNMSFIMHFYDPDTKMNYTGDKKYTAFNAFRYHAIAAKNLYDYYGEINKEVIIELSKAAHFLADINESHHSSNIIADVNVPVFAIMKYVSIWKKLNIEFEDRIAYLSTFGSFEKTENFWNGIVGNHSYFEKRASEELYKKDDEGNYIYLVDTLKSPVVNRIRYKPYIHFIDEIYDKNLKKLINNSARYSKDRIDLAVHKDNHKLNQEWKENLKETLPMAQIKIAEFLYVFMNEILK